MDTSLRLVIWGSRGLISSPRPETAIFGGNTTCLQILYKNQLIIVDTGFGVSNLGEQLFSQALKGVSLDIHIFYSHFHWDHVQGLPFFHPIYFPSTCLNLYSPLSQQKTFANLDILFDGSYSPFAGLKSMPSKIKIHQMETKTKIGDLTVEFQQLDHCMDESKSSDENNSYAFKFIAPDETSIVIATDHEARQNKINDDFVKFASNTDLLVHGAQYTESEYEHKKGWGNSNYKQALDNISRIMPNRAILTHHDPKRNDNEIQSIYREYKGKEEFKHLSFEFAREELIYEVQLKKAKISA